MALTSSDEMSTTLMFWSMREGVTLLGTTEQLRATWKEMHSWPTEQLYLSASLVSVLSSRIGDDVEPSGE